MFPVICVYGRQGYSVEPRFNVMLHGTICNDNFQCNTALQHCSDIVSNSFNIDPTLQRCVAPKSRRCKSSRVTSPLRTPAQYGQLVIAVIPQHDWPIEQCLLHIKVFFGGKTKRPCFDLFIHLLIKQITNTYRNHFSRSYENRSIFFITLQEHFMYGLRH